MQDTFLLISSYHLLLFTDYMTDVEVQYYIGGSYIFFIVCMLLYNIYGFGGQAVRDCRMAYHKRFKPKNAAVRQ